MIDWRFVVLDVWHLRVKVRVSRFVMAEVWHQLMCWIFPVWRIASPLPEKLGVHDLASGSLLFSVRPRVRVRVMIRVRVSANLG